MAYQKKQDGQKHAFQIVGEDLKEGKIGPAVALFGREQYLVNWSLGQIIKKYINPACADLDLCIIEGSKASLGIIIEACEACAMMSEKRVVAVRDFALLEGGKMKAFSETDESLLADYIKQVPDNCLLVFMAGGADKRKKLYKAVSSRGQAYEFGPLGEKDLKAFTEKRFRAAGKSAKASVIDSFVQGSGYFHKESGYTLYSLENDIRKIIAYSSGPEILLGDVREVVSGNLETSVFAMLDAISMGKKGEAFRLLHALLGSGENLYMLLSLIVSQFELILEVKEILEEGKNPAQIHGILKIHEFRIKKAMSFAPRYSLSSLRKILAKAYEIDRNIKTGILEQNLAMELFIAQV